MAIKYLHDHYDAKFFLTGSSSFYQKRTEPEIDFVIPDKGLAVEVKSRGNDRDMARLDKLAEAM